MTRKEYLLEQREKGRRLFGVFPAHYPKEILWAWDIVPAEIWDPPLDHMDAGGHLQPYICSVVKSGLELILRGKCDFLDGFLFPHTCDSIQNMSSVVHDYLGPKLPCYFFYHPKEPYSIHARDYYLSQLRSLISSLEKAFGPVDQDKLNRAVEWGKQISEKVRRLYDLQAQGALGTGSEEFYRVLRLGEYLFPDDYLARLDDLLTRSESVSAAGGQGGVVLSGVLPNPSELLAVLDSLGARVGGDDFLALSRRLVPWKEVESMDDPLDALTARYFALPPCSTKGSSIEKRLSYLSDLIEKSGARGVIFWQVKYCEPELFDVPMLSEELKKKGVKVLVFDTDLNEGLTGQLTTRLEAFLEML